MTLAASPPPEELSSQHQELSDRLDDDIARVRAEIESLTKRKNLLVSSLLSSTKIQSQLANNNDRVINDQNPLEAHAQHNLTNIHRLAYGVTSFPFTDPNPDTSDKPLLGVRFDIPSRNGQFDKAPYYIFLKRIDEGDEYSTAQSSGDTRRHSLKIHHHTIPALVPLEAYAARYLPSPVLADDHTDTHRSRDEGYFSTSADNDGNDEPAQNSDELRQDTAADGPEPVQDLHALVAAVRHDLLSWQLRNDAISLAREQLGLADGNNGRESDRVNAGKFSVQLVEATAVDARFVRLVWQNGTVARLRLTDDGHIDRAVVLGDTGGGVSSDRMKDMERLLTSSRDGGQLKFRELTERLALVETKMLKRSLKSHTEAAGGSDSHGSMDVDD